MSFRTRPAAVLTLCIATAVVLLLTGLSRRTVPEALAVDPPLFESPAAAPGQHWFVGDGLFRSTIEAAAQPANGVPVDWASNLYVLNPGAVPAHAELIVYRTSGPPSRSLHELAPGRLFTVDLARRPDVPRGEPFWIALNADRPVFPQLTHAHFRPWDIVPEALTTVPPQPGPLDGAATEWIYPDGFQGGTDKWIEQETVSVLNPGPRAAGVRMTFVFRDGRAPRTHHFDAPPGRMTLVELARLFTEHGEGTPLSPVVSGDYAMLLSASQPVVSQQTRRVFWRGRREVTSLSARVPLTRRDVERASAWYYAGGWTRDLGHLPRDGMTDLTWHLLFTFPLGARSAVLQPYAGRPQPARTFELTAEHSDLQWLHTPEWRAQLDPGEGPWGFRLSADGAIMPSITNAEFEPWSQAMPNGMGAANLVPDYAAARGETWLGVVRHGAAADEATEWSSVWQILNPGAKPLRATLSFFTSDAPPLEHVLTVAPHTTARVSGNEVPLPPGQPAVVRVRADGPVAAHVWTRAQARGVPVLRALAAWSGLALALDEPAAVVTN